MIFPADKPRNSRLTLKMLVPRWPPANAFFWCEGTRELIIGRRPVQGQVHLPMVQSTWSFDDLLSFSAADSRKRTHSEAVEIWYWRIILGVSTKIHCFQQFQSMKSGTWGFSQKNVHAFYLSEITQPKAGSADPSKSTLWQGGFFRWAIICNSHKVHSVEVVTHWVTAY